MRRPSDLLSPEHWRLLLLLGATSFFEGYDLNVVIVALPKLRSTFHLSQASASLWVSLLYLGALPAVVLARKADRHGRRRMLLVSITGYTIFTLATAAAPSIGVFAACQFASRFFLGLEGALIWTMVAEELPAGARGFGFGWLAMMAALGTGWSSILWGTILSRSGLSWRWLYVAAIPVLLVVSRLRLRLPESSRFTAAKAAGALTQRWRDLLRPPYRRWLLWLALIAFLVNLTAQAVVFVVDFMQTQRHQSATSANLILVGAGALAIPVLLIAGSVSDRIGRKPVCCAFLGVSVVGLVWFFIFARGPLELTAALMVTYAGQFGAWPTGSGFGTELFPTSLRALGGSATGAARVIGQCSSFIIAATFIQASGSPGRAVLFLCLGPVVGAVLIAAVLPETGGRDIDEISAPNPSATTGGSSLATPL